MRRFLTLTVLLLASHYAFSQATEICNNGLDDDFDGFIDCYDGSCANSPLCDGFLGNDAACEAVPPQFPQFTMSLDFSSPNETTNHLSRLAIGDLDRDGIPEMVTMNRYTKKIFILNGNNGTVRHEATVSWEPYWEVAIANIDNDNCGEIYFIGYQEPAGNNNDGVYIFAYDCQLNKLWETAQRLPGDPINFGLADFDGDGKVELYAKDEIYDAKTGVRIVKSTASNYGRQNGGPVAANIVGDDKLELISGLRIYQVNLGARTLDAGSLTLLNSRSEYFIRNEYNATSVADYNQDGFLDVLASGSTNSNGDNTTVFYWDVQNNTIRTYSDFQPALGSNYTKGWVNGTGRLNIADLDGNGQMNASYVSGRFLYALDENFNLLWRVNINEETSGHTGCTLFDFNGDGKAEIVYRDERFIYIIEGTDGSVYSQQACISRTNREYPIVADVDADGSTELCVPCGFNDTNSANNFNNLNYSRYSHIRVFKSAAEPWVPARRVWNQHGYFVVNVNDDLTIPRKLQAHQLVFSTGNCTQGPNRPLNKFLNQSPYLNSEGCPTYAAPDIAFQVEPTITPPTCPNLNFQVSFKITNRGDVAVTGSIPVSFYASDPMQANAAKLATINIPVTGLANGDIVSIDNQTITGNGSEFVYVVLNDAGTSLPTPIVLPNTNFIECDYDNIRFARINPLPVAITGVPVSASETCTSTANGVARAFVPAGGGGENTTDYNFYWSVGTTAKSIATADYVGPIYSGIPPGTYTVYARHKTANCNSDTTQVVIGSTTAPFPPITINVLSDQTSCSPFNGRLEAVIQGGGAGFTIDWYDIALNSLGISGPVANNLQAGSYLAVITRGTCNTSVPATVNPPTVPDAQASVVQHVLDCSNPNSGSVTADALVSGVVQNPANYTFTWYRYDMTNNTRGSILPAAHGTGKTRTGLPVGYYQVEVKENSSQCPSTITPIVQVEPRQVTPDVPQIVILSSQTSCDPSQPNGVMTANVTVGGVAQNPADFTFEWFKGQNTLAANLQTDVSDVNGKTVNKVAADGTPYTVRVTNAFNCSAIADMPMTETIIRPVVTLAQLTPNTVCDPAKASTPYNGSLQASVTFDNNPVTLPDNNYTFEWRNPANAIIAVADNKNPILTGLQDGNAYSVTVRRVDLACVSAPDTEPVQRATVLPALATTSTGSNTCDVAATPDGTATVSITNSVPADAFTFRWHSGNAVVPANVLAASNNFNQATAIQLGGVTGSPNPYTVLVTNTRTGCENTATQFVSDESVIPVISFLNVTANTKCVAPFDGGLSAQITNQIGPIANYNFDWYNGNSNASPVIGGVDGAVLSNRDVGFYTVEVENTVTGCRSTAITNQVPDGRVFPAISFNSVGSQNCDALITPRGSITANVTNGGTAFSYAWTSVAPAPAVNASNNFTSQTLINVGGPTGGLAPRSYDVLVTNTATGCANTSRGQVADLSQKPTLTLLATPNGICDASILGGPTAFNGSLTVNSVTHPAMGTSTINYAWFEDDGVTPNTPSPNAATLGQLPAGRYGVSVTVNDLGCTSDVVIDEVLDTTPTVDIVFDVDPLTNCAPVANNGRVEVTSPVGASIRYQWYTGSSVLPVNSIGGATNALLGNNLAGGVTSNFTVLVTDLNTGCRYNEAANVPDARVTPTISLSVVQHNTVCDIPAIAPTGELLATVGNAGTNFTIAWTGGVAPHALVAGANGEEFTQLQPGAYGATVTNDDTGCTSVADSENILNNVVYPNILTTVVPQTSCNVGTPNGSITATDGGITAGRTFDWFTGIGTGGGGLTVDGGDPANLIDDLTSDDYTVRLIIDATGCSSTRSDFVNEVITQPAITFAAIGPVTRCDNPDGSVTPSVTDASTNFRIFYVFTDVNGTPPNTAAAVTGAPTIPFRTDLSAYTGLEPGFVTAVVRNMTTQCESNPFTGVVPNVTDTYNITISGTAPSTACGDPNGGVDITVAGGSGSYDFSWHRDTPTNPTDINFFNNLPDFTGNPTPGAIATTEDLGSMAAPPDPTVTTGTYTVVVTDQNNGCGNYFITNVPFVDAPTVTVTPTHSKNCATPDGAINVVVGPDPGNVTGYSILFFSGNSPVAANTLKGEIDFDGVDNDFDGQDEATDPDAIPNTLNLTGIAPGDYFVQVIDNDMGNRPCPIGRNVRINKDAKNPLVTVAQVLGNTSCDPAAVAEGQVELIVNTAVGDSNPKSYHIESISPTLPQGLVIPVSPGLIIGTGAAGQSTGLIGGFLPQAYTFRILDAVSSCFRDVTVTVPNQQDLPGNILVTPTPETACAPGSNGSALATLQSGQAENEFDFTWFEDNGGTSIVYGANPGVAGAGTNGELLNESKVAALDWNPLPVVAGFGSGDRTFYVRAVRNANAPSGFGCATPIRQVVITDAHIAPQIALVPTINSFCDAINPGDLGDGSIAVTVDANPSVAGVQGSTGGFNYTWTTPNAGLAMPQNGVPNTLTIPQLGNGSYTVDAVNVDNGCITTSSTTITPAPFTISLTTTVLDQQICNPDGTINVTQITIDRTAAGLGNITQTSALPLTTAYDFEWFAADPGDPNTIVMTPLQDGVGPTDINRQSLVTGNGVGQFPAMGAGSYYVVATRRMGAGVATGCSSFPVRVDVDDVHANPLINLKPFSNTSCLSGVGTGEGIIEIRVTDPTPLSYNGGAAFSYDYDWTTGGITDALGNDGDGVSTDGDNDRETNLLEGGYGITVTNPASGCFSTATTTIVKNATPIFVQNVVKADQISCDPDGDGSLNVTRVTLNDRQGTVETFDASGTASPISDFRFTWTRPAIGTQTTLGTLLDVNTYDRVVNFGNTPIGAGTYTVVATRFTVPGPDAVGRGCTSAPFTIAIQDQRRFPVVSLTPFANTACDPAFSEGSIEVRVSDATLVAGPHTFSYDWDNALPANPTVIPDALAANGNGAGADGDNPQGLFHGVYDVLVTNNQSGCTSTASTELFRNSTPIIIPEAIPTPQVLCSADGTIRVTSVEVTDRNNNTFAAPFADFDFTWTPANGGPSVVTDGALGAVPGGTIVDRTVYPTIERGQYFVTAMRVGGTLGRGCVSAPYHATIDDMRVFPELTFSQVANSSCTPVMSNGQIIATARELDGTTDTYTFDWTFNSVTTANGAANPNTFANAAHGLYLVTATNDVTDCPVTSPVTLLLDQSLSTPNIIQVTTVDPLDCNPTGQAAVTRITLGSTTSSILFPPNVPPNNEVSGADLLNYNYRWYQGLVAPGNQLPIGGPFTTTPTITSLLTGTYYVEVQDPTTECVSGAREVIINPDDIILPDLLLTQTGLQISCRPGIGSAELSVTADGQTDADPNYTFTWFANDSATPPSIANTSTLSDIVAGTYSVTVHNNTTNCSISDSYIVEDDTQEFTPVLSMASQPRTLCVGTDGELITRILNLSPLYPYSYTPTTFTADLYFGQNPNLSLTPDMPAIPPSVGLIGNFSQNNLNEGFYTVRVTDNNTGCFAVATEEIKDARQYPTVAILEIAPVTNCDPARPNGVAQVTANNTFVGFTFEWYEGSAVSGAPVYTGAEFGELKVKPQQYTVRATDINSGCFTDANTDIEDGTVPIPAATIEVLSHVTSCVEDNGSLMAYVGVDKNTANYIFHWYDGTVENPPADNIGETYNDRPVGQYSVTATSIITGCKSPLTSEEIVNEQVFPNFDFIIQNTTCDQNDGFATMILLSDAPIERIEWINIANNSEVAVGPNFTNAGAGFYEITATTFLGCATTKQIEIKPDIRPYNGISRNNDGRNEHFQIDCIQNFPANNVKIFNRAGTLVYEGDAYDNSNTVFDGKSNRGISPMGVNLPDGTYYYIVDKRDGSKPIAGYLEIVQ